MLPLSKLNMSHMGFINHRLHFMSSGERLRDLPAHGMAPWIHHGRIDKNWMNHDKNLIDFLIYYIETSRARRAL